VRILIIDDNAMVRRGVARLLSFWPSWAVCGEAGDGKEALAKAKELHPDLVLLDVSMPGVNGLEVASAIRREIPAAMIVIMSQHDRGQLLPRALQAGANACMDKNTLSTDLLPTIEKLAFQRQDTRRNSLV
jgi:DNA-binding NarL/FixJ family response regulator